MDARRALVVLLLLVLPLVKVGKTECPTLSDGDNLTQDDLLNRLTINCSYDKLKKPDKLLTVHTKVVVTHMEAVEHLQIRLNMLLQYRYYDPRLEYKHISPNRPSIIGGEALKNKVWVPHVLIDNEKTSDVMGTKDTKDVLVVVSPEGEVKFTRRMYVTIFCWMNLQKFPFDEQTCEMKLKSWVFNASDMHLKWELVDPLSFSGAPLLTEYSLESYTHSEDMETGSAAVVFPPMDTYHLLNWC